MGTYHTFEDLVNAARAQGATHVTMGNWHEGAFWMYRAIDLFSPSNTVDMLWFAELMKEIVGERYVKRLTHLAHFIDSDARKYQDWQLYPWRETNGATQHPDGQFIPIDMAVSWYQQWNPKSKERIWQQK